MAAKYSREEEWEGELMYEELEQSWTRFLGYAFFKNEKNFDLSNHIGVYDRAGDSNLTSPCTEKELMRIVAGLSSKPWRRDVSPWELLLVPNYAEEGSSTAKTVFILRIHHAMADDKVHVLYCHDKDIGLWFIPGVGKGPLQPEQLKIMRKIVEARP